jgi:hypothetical protein
MKKILLTLATLLIITLHASAQEMVTPNKPFETFSSTPGYMTINEISLGYGLSERDLPYEGSFAGFTTIHGYQINKSFSAGLGTGVIFYNGGTLVPLLFDFRYNIKIAKITPYLWGDGGLLLDPSAISSTKLYINPGAGARYAFSRKVAMNLGVGFWTQQGSNRSSFAMIRTGLAFKP